MWKISPEGTLLALGQANDANTGVWVPSEKIVFHYAELPPGRQKVWEETVAFVLEEQLIGFVDEQHFVIGGSSDVQDKIAVAVVSLKMMQAWVDIWHEQGVKPRAVWPDVLAVPLEKGRPVLWHEGGRCLLRFDAYTGIAGSLEWVQSLLEVVNEGSNLRVFSDNVEELSDDWRDLAEPLPCSLDEKMRAGPDEYATQINFLQATFRPVSMLSTMGMPWKWVAVAMFAAFVLYTALLTMETRLINENVASLKQATIELQKQHFPEQASIANLRSQVGKRMAQVKGGVVERDTNLWQALLYVEPVISSCKACRVEEIKLEDSSLSLILSLSSDADKFLQKIGNIKEIEINSESLPAKEERTQLLLKLRLEKDV